jgi:hypothetical protein
MDDAPIPPHIAKPVWTEFSGGTPPGLYVKKPRAYVPGLC